MALKTYEMPILTHGYNREELIGQSVDALEYLESVSSDIFNRISRAVAEQRDQLVVINRRINNVKAKVETLQSSRSKGTIVFSLSKYPAPTHLRNQTPVFSQVDEGLSKVKRSKSQLSKKFEPFSEQTLEEYQQFVTLSNSACPLDSEVTLRGFRATPLIEEESEGLGSLPNFLPSISSLLLFNTSENPYRNYILIDPLSGGVVRRTREMINDREGISEAPNSILTREELIKLAPGSLGYTPLMTEIPELEVPLCLPRLTNIAEDITYDADLGPSIAPSLANMLLPNMTDETSSLISETPTMTSLPPAEPQPPDEEDKNKKSTQPTPPRQSEMESDSDSSSDDDDADDDSPAADDDRGALLKSIETFSKSKLKPTDRRKERKVKKQEEKEELGGDIMSDLNEKLRLMREAISGQKEKRPAASQPTPTPTPTKSGSILDQISSLIPNPAMLDQNDGSGGSGMSSEPEDW